MINESERPILVAPMPTPFTVNDEVNLKAIEDNSVRWINSELSGFVLGTEKWGLSKSAIALMDESIFIPMRGMVQSLNVSVAAATFVVAAAMKY